MVFDPDALQAALWQRLRAEIPDVECFDHVPQSSPYPYIRIDGIDAEPDDAKDIGFTEYDITLSVFDADQAGNLSVARILKRIAAALHDQEDALTAQADENSQQCLAGFKVIILRCTYQTAFQQGAPNDSYYHGVQRYRALVQEL